MLDPSLQCKFLRVGHVGLEPREVPVFATYDFDQSVSNLVQQINVSRTDAIVISEERAVGHSKIDR